MPGHSIEIIVLDNGRFEIKLMPFIISGNGKMIYSSDSVGISTKNNSNRKNYLIELDNISDIIYNEDKDELVITYEELEIFFSAETRYTTKAIYYLLKPFVEDKE
ncbi:MAG: hypothetical protein J7K26_01220 [Candidatus Aenigmarchaeota archaeon]|nr:hypothetical protein [Candidatus Aenigmarchaeota archaeon]